MYIIHQSTITVKDTEKKTGKRRKDGWNKLPTGHLLGYAFG